MIIKHKKIKSISKVSVGLLSLVAVIGGIYTLSTHQAYGAPDDSSYKLVWEDNFDGAALNTDNWDYQTGGWGDSGIQACYKMNENNVNVGGGTLKLTAQYEPGVACGQAGTRDFTSGFVQTRNKKYWTYGYVEARIKMPNNNGSTWPAFWMSPNESVYGSWPRSGEIDIFEAKGHDSNYLAANAHWGVAPGAGNKRQAQGNVNVNTLSTNGTADWHTYAVKWQEGRMDFYIDGQHFHTINNFQAPNATTHPGPFNIPFYIRLNLAIGGTYLTPPHNDAHNNSDKFPTTMEIDYVRVYQKSDANAETVNIPDSNLRRQINRSLTSTTGAQRTDNQAITVEEIKNLNYLVSDLATSAANSDKITDLTGLEKAVNLTKVSLKNHGVQSVAPLAGLTHLTSINLTGNAIADISPLNNLAKLKEGELNLSSQKHTITTTTATFPSPLKDNSGATVAIQNSTTLANDTAGSLKLVSPVYDGQAHTAQAPWATSVTIGGATATFSGTLTVNATLPQQQPQPDLSGLRAAIAAAESEPDYIKNDSAVAAALNQAKAVVAQTNPSQTDVQNATNNLNSAVAAAKQKEQNAQAAAETAVAAAENSKRPSDITAAQAKVNAVQDPAKKASLQSRLNAVSSAITSALLALNSLIATAKDPATIAGMSSSSVAALQSQIAVAEAVANNANSSVTELDNARTALQAKIDALQSDTSALQSAISAAEAEPAYIKNDTAVAAALSQAKSVVAQTNPSQTDIQNATNNLNNAVASAKQKEQSAQAAAEAAVAKAEADKTQTAIDAAKILVDKVQDPAKKAALQARLDAIVVTPAPNPPTPPNPDPDPNPNPTAPITSATIPQPHGASVTISTSGDACYNLASAKVVTAPSRHNGRILRDVADFTIDCTNQMAATGFTTQVTLTLSRRYATTERLTIAKIANGSFKQDITSQVTFGTTSDGKYTTITYSLTDGGFGDEDNAANGTIVDPVGVYEEEGPLADNVNTLAKTGENIVLLVAGAILLGSGGFWIAKRELW